MVCAGLPLQRIHLRETQQLKTMVQTYKFHMIATFKNGTTLTLPIVAHGEDLSQASTLAQQEVQQNFDGYLSDVRVSFHEDMGPTSEAGDEETMGSIDDLFDPPAQLEHVSILKNESPLGKQIKLPTEIFLGNELIAVRTASYVMVTPKIRLVGRKLAKADFSFGFSRFHVVEGRTDPGLIMKDIFELCFDYITAHPNACLNVTDGDLKQYVLSLRSSPNSTRVHG